MEDASSLSHAQMKPLFVSAALAFMIGLIGFVAFFIVGSWSEKGEAGIAATCLVYLVGSILLTTNRPISKWYGGIAINIPIWLFFIGPADPGQFKQYLPGLLIALLCTYTGSLVGVVLLRRRNRIITERK